MADKKFKRRRDDEVKSALTLEDVENEIKQEIDLYNLEKVLTRHPYLLQIATDKIADYKSNVGSSKFDLDTTYAMLYLEIRGKMELDGEKITEAILDAKIKSSGVYKSAYSKWLEAKAKYEKVESLRELFQTREAVLKHLTALYSAQYWTLSTIK